VRIGQSVHTPVPTPAATNTPAYGNGQTATAVAQLTGTPQPPCTTCTLTFNDVPPENTFYPFVRCLACQGLVNGYPDGTFHPNNYVTRGQLSKIVSNAAAFNDAIPETQQTFTDVPSNNTFYLWIERMVAHGVINGYPCGSTGEPCDGQNRPYFRWGANATRGQISKIVSEARGFNEQIPSTQQSYADVPANNPFWLWIERLNVHSVMSGYPCGSTGEPCDGQNRPYFRWGANATRGQTSKIVANTFFPDCSVP
jgi:hypothetical protein